MIPLPSWMQRALFITAAMNLLAAAAFLPAAEPVRALMGFPPAGNPLYVSIVALMVLTFGLGYLWAALAGAADRLFIAVSAFGKAAFCALLGVFWMSGELSGRAAASGLADLVFAALFVAWLLDTRPRPRAA